MRNLERLRFRGILSAHIPQDLKARFSNFFLVHLGPRAHQFKSFPGFGPGKGGSKSDFREATENYVRIICIVHLGVQKII